MSPLLLLLILQRIVMFGVGLSAVATMMQDGNLISEIGDFFAEALRGLADEPPKFDGVMADIAAPQVKLTPGEADRKEHAERTLALSDALQSWLRQSCQLDETQQGQMKELVAKLVAKENEAYAKKNDPARQNRPFGDSTPLLFVQPKSVGATLCETLLTSIRKEILNDAQKSQLDAARKERTDFQNAAFAEFVVGLFDIELYLTDDQHQEMLAQFSANSKSVTSPFYSFVGQNYYLPYQPLSSMLSVRNARFLDDRQKERLKDLTTDNSSGNQNYIMFQSSEGPEQWEENIKRAAVTQRKTYLHAAAVRIGYFERSLNLTAEQIAHLTVASKGATTTALADWKETTHQTVDQMKAQMGQMQGNFAFSAQNISIDGLDGNQIWADAVRHVNAHNQAGNRSSRIRLGRAKTVTALLDQELWLTPQQREDVLTLTQTVLPKNNTKSDYDDYVRELVLVAYPLHKAPDADVSKVLSEPQLAVWKQLQNFLRFNRSNNYVEIPMKNQGGSFSAQLTD